MCLNAAECVAPCAAPLGTFLADEAALHAWHFSTPFTYHEDLIRVLYFVCLLSFAYLSLGGWTQPLLWLDGLVTMGNEWYTQAGLAVEVLSVELAKAKERVREEGGSRRSWCRC